MSVISSSAPSKTYINRRLVSWHWDRHRNSSGGGSRIRCCANIGGGLNICLGCRLGLGLGLSLGLCVSHISGRRPRHVQFVLSPSEEPNEHRTKEEQEQSHDEQDLGERRQRFLDNCGDSVSQGIRLSIRGATILVISEKRCSLCGYRSVLFAIVILELATYLRQLRASGLWILPCWQRGWSVKRDSRMTLGVYNLGNTAVLGHAAS